MKKNLNALLDWYDTNPRDYPWRKDVTPYKTWLSEIILQQTRVEQGTPYFIKFIKKYPSVQELADASEEEILKMWEGLGYYSRARNLHFTAKKVVNDWMGVFPSTYKDLMTLKGVGSYTAAAIASICFDERVPAMDGNANRVYARFFGYQEYVNTSSGLKNLFNLALEAMPKNRSGDFNQAIMDLGSWVCKPKTPICTECPLRTQCSAYRENLIEVLPLKKKTIKVKKQAIHFAVLLSKGGIFMSKMNSLGFWKDLYTLPIIHNQLDGPKEEQLNFGELLFRTHHLLSHRKLELFFWKVQKINSTQDLELLYENDFDAKPMPKPIVTFLKDFY